VVARTHHQEAVRHILRQAAVVARTHRWEAEAVRSRRPGAGVAEVAEVAEHSRHPVVEAVEVSDFHREVAAAVARPTLNPP
jgi:hypothetical protein